MNDLIDFLGRTIAVDDILVYPVRRGSKMWLKRIKVTKIECDIIHGINPQSRLIKLTNLKNTVVVSVIAQHTLQELLDTGSSNPSRRDCAQS